MEIPRAVEEPVAPQCARVMRKWGDEWVVYEEEHTERAVHKLEATMAEAMRQVKIGGLHTSESLALAKS